MSFVYDAGLRIRPPEPMPDCIAGETPQQYFSRVLIQCALESATSAENASGDSAATPFNIGQVQHDLAQAQADITALETADAEQQTSIDSLLGKFAGGTASYESGATMKIVSLPSSGTWHCVVSPLTVSGLTGVFVSHDSDKSFTLNFDAAADAGSFDWVAIKE